MSARLSRRVRFRLSRRVGQTVLELVQTQLNRLLATQPSRLPRMHPGLRMGRKFSGRTSQARTPNSNALLLVPPATTRSTASIPPSHVRVSGRVRLAVAALVGSS